MTRWTPPAPEEYSAGFAPYIGKAGSPKDPVQRLETQLAEAVAYFAATPPDRRLYRYAPEKWSIQQVLGHLIDAERVFAYRALRFARADHTPLAGFDENAYVAAAGTEDFDWQELIEEFRTVRQSTILLLKHLPEDAWVRVGVSNKAPLSVRALFYVVIGHVDHHLGILKTRYV